MKGRTEKARLSLRYFRGPYGTVDQELSIMQDSLAKVLNRIYLYIVNQISISNALEYINNEHFLVD